jgi:hypothetical protein
MELSANLLTPTTLFLEKMPTKDNQWEAGWAPQPMWRRDKFLAPGWESNHDTVTYVWINNVHFHKRQIYQTNFLELGYNHPVVLSELNSQQLETVQHDCIFRVQICLHIIMLHISILLSVYDFNFKIRRIMESM